LIGLQTTHAFLYASVSITSPVKPALLCVPLNDSHEFSVRMLFGAAYHAASLGLIGPKTGCASIA
jgi:hypothetical protein